MITALLEIGVDCDGSSDGCHSFISTENDLVFYTIDDISYEDWISEHGWLVLGKDTAYCPVCRFELHD